MAQAHTLMALAHTLIALNHLNSTEKLHRLPYLLPTSVSLAVIKDLSTNYMMALGLNQAYTYIAKIT